MSAPAIKFYTSGSPNGHKVAIVLEELELPYTMRAINMSAIEHKEEWFTKINPNGRIPAIEDVLPDGTPIKLFESGSIQQYLVERYDTEYKISYPRGTKEYLEVNNWLWFLNANIGPIQGQCNHFVRYSHATTPQDYALDRYGNEARRLWRVLDKHLSEAGTDYMVGNKCTIADMAISPWARIFTFAGLDDSEWPAVRAWQKRMMARPAVQKGCDTPSKVDLEYLKANPEAFKEYIAMNERWVRQGMEENRKRQKL